mgnify:CR=1 FL=1
MIITSTSNQRIKEIRKLHDRKGRRERGLFYVEGLRHVIEVDKLGLLPEMVVYAPELLTSQAGWTLIEKWGDVVPNFYEVSQEVFRSISVREDPQGISVVMRQSWESLDKLHPEGNDIWIALDSVADPGNLGTVFRTADAIGAKGVILLDQCTDPYDPSAVRASMGSIFSLEVSQALFQEFKHWKKQNGISLVGTSDRAKLDYQEMQYPERMVLLMGSERSGLQDYHLSLCDDVVRIPMMGRCDSLNLAVATSVILYEIFNQHRKPMGKER